MNDYETTLDGSAITRDGMRSKCLLLIEERRELGDVPDYSEV